MAPGPITSLQIAGETVETVADLFLGAPKSLQMETAAKNKKTLTPWKESYTNLDSILKSRDITLSTEVHLVKAMVFPVVMYGCESWTITKAECRRIDAFELVLGKMLESPLVCKEIQPVHSKDYSWVFIGRTDVEAETPILWSPYAKS